MAFFNGWSSWMLTTWDATIFCHAQISNKFSFQYIVILQASELFRLLQHNTLFWEKKKKENFYMWLFLSIGNLQAFEKVLVFWSYLYFLLRFRSIFFLYNKTSGNDWISIMSCMSVFIFFYDLSIYNGKTKFTCLIGIESKIEWL